MEFLKKENWDERPPWSDSLSAARALVMWKGRRLLIGARRSGEALERRAVLVRKDIVEDGKNTIVRSLNFNALEETIRQVLGSDKIIHTSERRDVIDLYSVMPAGGVTSVLSLNFS